MKDIKGTSLNLTLGILLVVYIFNFLDRQVVAILAEPIAKELHLSDTEIGLLTGLAFALLYTALGIPIARIADRPRTNRVAVIAVSVAIWSAFTALCGMAQNFTHLLLARVGVGIGEAGCTPPAHSLITDKAPPERRARAFAIYQLGPPLGGLIGMVMGGVLADSLGWREAFVVVGLPGVILAAVVAFVLRDPRKLAGASTEARTAPKAMSTGEAIRAILESRAMRRLLVTAGFGSFAGYGVLIWATIFFQRSHGLTAGETGIWFGLVNGVASALGVWLGGHIGDRQLQRGKQHLLTPGAVLLMASAPFLVLALLAPRWEWAMAAFFPAILFNWIYVAPYYSAVQGLVPPSARAVASAMILFMQNLIGLGLGPLVLGMLSDLLKPTFGLESVRYVLFIACLFGLTAGAVLLSARKFLPEELDRHS